MNARARLALPREERHPNAASAPPLHRGSMVSQPWRGFWRGIAGGLGAAPAAHRRSAQPRAPWQDAADRRRLLFALLTFASAVIASWLYARAQPDYGNPWLQWGQIALFAILSTWVVTGFVTALMGFWVSLRGDAHALSARAVQHHSIDPEARTAIVMSICNEDVATVFAGLRATCESVAATGHARVFDVFVLSDSNDPALIAAERAAWAELRSALAAHPEQPQIEVYYRLRTRRTHRKAGNVADFCRRWGRDYRYMVVLDADSVMSGDCIASLVKLMEAHPRAGIIQTASQAVGHATLHARGQQFASRVTGRLFTLGMQFWQLGESHYWGHNAILRIAPFMQHCALAPIPGRGGLCGPIMSHDFVEAALMRRAGWHVWLVSDLQGSYEQQPPDLLSELQRDRRWCQGNLQNAQLIAEPGLHRVHRAMFAIGAMSYLSAPLWLAFLAFGTTLWMTGAAIAPDWHAVPAELRSLWAWTLVMLFMPRVLGVLAVVLRGAQGHFGGTRALLAGALVETVVALLQAPVRMLAHSFFVLVALTGWKLEWKSPPREAAGLGWGEAARQLAPMTALIALQGLGLAAIQHDALVWLAPVALPLLLAVPLAVLTSHVRLGDWVRAQGVLVIPEEHRSPAVLRRAWRHARVLAAAA
ncbi:MAG TPA: glucans biosynthesis glucosyltransferase MdoH [Ramlibacter sp.]|uniref:glucans biosynthesis glucosyltransferase MdoH n=1 Tax=Ramlibacter sp. TaxID=1917967 RepID=UPI002D7E5BAE|nr:glucans biosynthesis glucosyltransferase MdoH [Ramlibacter sp.]HET8744448.1 glucans biosynthesis glucosyltransferase MdoH [Ramlibacter sp.]